MKWYRKSAEQGLAAAQCNLGFMYSEGRGVDKDDAEAEKWYRKAADQGYAQPPHTPRFFQGRDQPEPLAPRRSMLTRMRAQSSAIKLQDIMDSNIGMSPIEAREVKDLSIFLGVDPISVSRNVDFYRKKKREVLFDPMLFSVNHPGTAEWFAANNISPIVQGIDLDQFGVFEGLFASLGSGVNAGIDYQQSSRTRIIVILFFAAVECLCLLIAVLPAFIMDKSLHKKHPKVKPYKWGYYVGWTGFLARGCVSVFGSWLLVTATDFYGDPLEFIPSLVICIVLTIVHFFIIKRNRWAWIVATISTFNPILWIINGIYLKNRWSEMGGGTNINVVPKVNIGNQVNKMSFRKRVLVFGSVLWCVVVLAFVFMFEPYGGYVSSSEQWQIVKIIISPLIVAAIGYFLLIKVVIRGGSR